MKDRWESNINVWVLFMYSWKWNCYFQKRIIMFCLPAPTLRYLWEIYIFPGLVYPFCCRVIRRPILVIYKSIADTWMWKLGLRPRNSQKRNTSMEFSLQCTITTKAPHHNNRISTTHSINVSVSETASPSQYMYDPCTQKYFFPHWSTVEVQISYSKVFWFNMLKMQHKFYLNYKEKLDYKQESQINTFFL